MDAIGESFHFHEYNKALCPFRKYGCRDSFPEFEKRLHEKVCPLRYFFCPICVIWKGTAENFRSHIAESFWQRDSVYFPIKLERGIEVLRSGDEAYVLFYRYEMQSGYLYIALKYALLEDTTCPVCKVIMDGPIIQSHIGHSMCHKCNEMTLRMNKTRNFALEELCVKMSKYTKNTDNKFDDEEVLKGLECPVCLDYMRPPVKVCLSGHSICKYCRPKLNECPMCRRPFTTVRNLSLESISNKIHYKCMNANKECEFSDVLENICNHEENCSSN
ncbi:hypothetical protein ILUMI_24446 [Ignelater luminosus]|uniref:RING-type domain-containing protein n=1 Tax=Ignelater luminosus TaxID=2038154 RepID=A0A8K0C961_IGNLU|nr:hypothetical protein ILUMI_24446 [Ignelater luminosus]